jgi:hypothetical protein
MEYTKILTTAIVGGIVGAMFTSLIVYAWTGPTQAAPAGNVAAPVNVGPSDQVKNAGLSLNALTVFGNGVLTGKIGIGSSNIPAYTLDVTGTGRLTGSLTTGSITSGSIAANGSITNTSAITYGPVSLESWGLYNTGANGGGSIYIEPKPGTAFYITPSDWTQNLTTVINGGLQVNSQINNTSGGYRFPDGTVQTSAAGGVSSGSWCGSASYITNYGTVYSCSSSALCQGINVCSACPSGFSRVNQFTSSAEYLNHNQWQSGTFDIYVATCVKS